MVAHVLAAFRPIKEMKWIVALGLLVGALLIWVVMKLLDRKYGSGDDAAEAYEEKRRLKMQFDAGEISEAEYRAAKAAISARERDLYE